jgi:hypothetical protein
MKKIIILAVIILSKGILIATDIGKIINYNSSGSDDYDLIIIDSLGVGKYNTNILGSNNNFFISSNVYGADIDVYDGSNTLPLYDYDLVKRYTELNIGGSNLSNRMVLEIIDSSISYGFLYSSPNFQTTDTIPQSVIDATLDLISFTDSINTADGYSVDTTAKPFTNNNFGFGGSKSYVISYDQPDPYKIQYTPSELDYYYVYYNSSNDYLQRIVDTDRNNKLVGFRFYSLTNNQQYDIFIEPNN